MLIVVYKSIKKVDIYFFIEKRDDFGCVFEFLLEMFG